MSSTAANLRPLSPISAAPQNFASGTDPALSGQTPHSLHRRCRGFSVVEVMFAVLVLAFAISTSLATIQVGYRAIDTARNTTLAGQILQSLVEDVRMMPWATTNGMTGVSTLTASKTGPVSDFDTTGSFSATTSATTLLSRFTVKRDITTVSAAPTGMLKIIFTASWTGIDGKSHSVKYTTYYAQNGVYNYYYN
jgi:uncharacterized protein (TIGR02598 family)